MFDNITLLPILLGIACIPFIGYGTVKLYRYAHYWFDLQLAKTMIQHIKKATKRKLLIIMDDEFTEISKKIPDTILTFDSSIEHISNLCNSNIYNGVSFGLDVIIQTTGGASDVCEKISKILSSKTIVDCYIPNYANSAGAYVALMCNTIYMSEWAHITPCDTMVYNEDEDKTYPTKDYVSLATKEHFADIAFEKKMLVLTANTAHLNTINTFRQLYKNKQTVEKIIDNLVSGKNPHGKPFMLQDLKNMGVNVVQNVPREYIELIYQLENIGQ